MINEVEPPITPPLRLTTQGPSKRQALDFLRHSPTALLLYSQGRNRVKICRTEPPPISPAPQFTMYNPRKQKTFSSSTCSPDLLVYSKGKKKKKSKNWISSYHYRTTIHDAQSTWITQLLNQHHICQVFLLYRDETEEGISEKPLAPPPANFLCQPSRTAVDTKNIICKTQIHIWFSLRQIPTQSTRLATPQSLLTSVAQLDWLAGWRTGWVNGWLAF